MINYKFVRINVRGLFNPTPEEDYRKRVKELAEEDWRLVQVFAPGLGPYGRPTYYDLIFEKTS